MAAGWSALGVRVLETALVPDAVVRAGIRRVIQARLREQRDLDPAKMLARRRMAAADRSTGPIAIVATDADAQHEDMPATFFRNVLGRHMKYSCAFWAPGVTTLDDAEERMLALTAERAGLLNGQRVLDLGCGWGALSLWAARAFPASEIVGVSNSRAQKNWIDEQIKRDGIANLKIVTDDMDDFRPDGVFDRIVSVEMFEHMRNWRALLQRISRWLADDGRMFLQIFSHRHYAYSSDLREKSDWIAQYFFSGGIMPSDDLIYEFQDRLKVIDHWRLSGLHYEKTAEAWLARMDARRDVIMPMLVAAYGERDARRWWARWRTFFIACGELWGCRDGEEWIVSHYALEKPSTAWDHRDD